MTATVVRYEPRGAARELFRTRDGEVVMVGAAGTGKSLACLYRVHLTALANPNVRCLIVRKTAVSLSATTLVTFRKKVAAEAINSRMTNWFGGSAQEQAGYRYSNGSFVGVGGMDKPEKIMSSEYDMVFCDEATELTVDDWEAIGSRLRNGVLAWQQQIAACNPGQPTHWLKQRCDIGKAKLLTSLHRDNPRYVNADGSYTPAGQDYIGGKLGALTGIRRKRLLEGQWAAAEGLVYDDWNTEVHLVDPRVIKPTWTRWLAVDFGYTNPFCAQWWAEDGDGRLYLYREIYKTRTLVEDHAKQIRGFIFGRDGRLLEPKPRAVICDHDAEDRATLERHLGMSTSAATKTVSDGIQAVQARLRPAGDGRPRLFVARGALVERDSELEQAKKPLCLEDEIGGYVWPDAAKAGKEAPVKENDHAMDAMRYMVAERDLGGRPSVRFL